MKIFKNSIGHWMVGTMIIPAGQAQVEVDGTQVTISLINRFVVIFSDDVTKLQREDGSSYGDVDTFLNECRFFFVSPTDPLLAQAVFDMQSDIAQLQTIVDALQSIGVMKLYSTYNDMDVDKTAPQTNEGIPIRYGQLVAVTEDSVTSKNGLYRWKIGEWELVKDLGDLSIYAKNGGSTKTLQELDTELATQIANIRTYLENVKLLPLIPKGDVDTFAKLATTYPEPQYLWAAKVTADGYIYAWNKKDWINTGLKEFLTDVAVKGGGTSTIKDLEDEDINLQNQITEHDNALTTVVSQVKGFVPITLPAITEDYYVDTDGVITSSENVHGYYELTTNLPDKIKITASNSNGEGVAFVAFFNEDTFISYEGAGNISLTEEEIDVPEGTTKILISVDLTNDNSTHVSFLQLDAASKDYVVSGGFGYFGVATPTDTPVNNNAPKYYIAKQVGTYTNFGGLEITTPGIYFLKYLRGVWTLEDMTDIFS